MYTVAPRAAAIAQGPFVAQRGVDRADVAKGVGSGASGVFGRHPALDELLSAHLKVKAQLVVDVAGAVVAQVGSSDDSAHRSLLLGRRRGEGPTHGRREARPSLRLSAELRAALTGE